MTTVMRTLLIGIDSGTQSTKALVVEARTGRVLGEAAARYDLIPNLPPGAKEQHPQTWRTAVIRAVRGALKRAHARAGEVVALGVSGQQHGFVPLDRRGEVIRPAKLWCDTVTVAESDEIMARLGGLRATLRKQGLAILPGYTASKILWLKRHEPRHYARLATVLLPHDYLNFWLTGERVMEYGDASGTALLNVRTRRRCAATITAIDAALMDKLPPLIPSDQPAGRLQPAAARELGLNPGILVSAGGGDNTRFGVAGVLHDLSFVAGPLPACVLHCHPNQKQ